MTEADPAAARPTRFRTGGLSPRKPTRFRFQPEAATLAALAEELGLLALHRLELVGEITPKSRDELELTATLKAVADQACIVTLAPVRAIIDEPVRRRYVAGLTDPDGDEIEMPQDDSLEPMPEVIDLFSIAAEALALALPLYPRAPGAEFGAALGAPEGVAPLTDADLKPFAGLAGLSAQLKGKDDPGPDETG